VHVLSGVIRFSTGTEQATLSAGSMVALDRDVLHSLEALEESVVLLTTAIG
jgi:quercetin dioxygenase-like cupin family protein